MSHPALARHEPNLAVYSHDLLPVWGKPPWESDKGSFTALKLTSQTSNPLSSTAWCRLLGWPWPFYHHPHFLCNCPQASSLSCMTQGWVFVHVHGAGVSELTWMEECCPARVSRTQGELSWQHSPWGSQDKVHHWEPRWALLKEHSYTRFPRRPTQAFVQIFSLGHRQL